MLSVQATVNTLREALDEKGVESHVHDAFGHLASCLVFLDSSSPPVQMIHELCAALRQRLLPLYIACLQPTLQLSSSVLSAVLGKLCDAHNTENEGLGAALDETAEVILSGILDFLDQKDSESVESGGAIWEVLYHTICEFFFPDQDREIPVFSIPLRLSAYNTLTEIATGHIAIRNGLRHSVILGGERLGLAIARTTDYLLLEALLTLFARLLPPIHNTSKGKSKRAKFVKEVLGSRKLFNCYEKLLDIMQKISGTDWDGVAAQIVDTLAGSDITYPQPFSIDEIDVCGRVFPQPLATDRLILDKEAFLANIIVENDDLCESLQVPYTRIRTITLNGSGQDGLGKVLIMVHLASPPLVANVEMKFSGENRLYARFLLEENVIGRFMEALRRRGVGKLNFLSPLMKVQKKRKNISIGSGFRFANDSSPVLPTGGFEGKVQHVNQVYRTDAEELAMSSAIKVPYVGGASFSPTSIQKPASEDESPIPEVAEVPPSILKSCKSLPPTNEIPNTTRGLSLPFSGSDGLSEISEFETDTNTVTERVVTGVSTSCSHKLKPTRREADHIRENGSSSITSAMEIDKSSNAISKIGDQAEAITPKSLEVGKSLLTLDSPVFGSSSTQIYVSPKSLSDVDLLLSTAGFGVNDSLPIVSRDLGVTEKLKGTVGEACKRFDMELNMTSEGKSGELNFAGGEFGQHPKCSALSSGPIQKGHPRVKTTKDMSTPLKIAGSRRKREPIRSSSKAIAEVDDESMPPRKKSRDDRLAIKRDKLKPDDTSLATASTYRMKRHRKMVKDSPGTDPMSVDFDEFPEAKSTRQGTRRSSRIRNRQTAEISARTQVDVILGKIWDGKLASGQLASDVECVKLPTIPLHDTGIKIDCTTPIPTPYLMSSLTREIPFVKTDDRVPLLEPSDAESITLETTLPVEAPKISDTPPCEPCYPTKDRDLSPQEAVSNTIRPAKGPSSVKNEIMEEHQFVSDFRAVPSDINQAQEVVQHSISKEDKNTVELSRPIVGSTPGQEIITIDLTVGNSPAKKESELQETPVSLVRPKTDIQVEIRSPSQYNSIAMEELHFMQSLRHERRSVTFASPIEYVLDTTVKSKKRANLSSWQSLSPSESNILSPLRILARTANTRRESPDRIASRVTLENSKSPQGYIKVTSHNQTADKIGMQDIAEVINEIQAVIIKGISDKFRNVQKYVQHGRDELVQQVLDELRDMTVENAKHFNDLVYLEENYYKNGKVLISCWEELIECNDGIAVRFQDALKEHDQNTSARTFPRSLLPLQPVFFRRRANT